METVFETGVFTGSKMFMLPLAIAVIVFGTVLYLRMKGKRVNGKIVTFGAVFALAAAVFVVENVMAYRSIVSAYRRGDYLTVEGEVYDLVPAATKRNPYEEFTVDGVRFALGGGRQRDLFGYDKTNLSGGAVDREGMIVRICYIPYDGVNVIVRLDVEESSA